MFYPEEIIEDVRIQNDIVDVISQYVKLNKKGNSHFGLCPFHNEKTPSFSVVADKQMYYCFGCGAGGNVITFIMEYENYSFLEALKMLADRVHITLPEPQLSEEMKKKSQYKQLLWETNKMAAKYFYHQLISENNSKSMEYLLNRGISEDTIKKFGLGYSRFFRDDLYQYLKSKDISEKAMLDCGLIIEDKNKPGEYFDRFFNRVMFPIFDVHGKVIGFGGRVLGEGMPKYLNSPETILFDKSKNLYGLNHARTSRRENIILAEGYMDVISLHQAGFDNAVASLGTAFTHGQVALLKRYTSEVVLAYDGDGAGINAAKKAIPILEHSGITVRVIDLSPYKDPDEFIKEKGADAFEEALAEAVPSFIFLAYQLEKQHNLKDPEHKTNFFHKLAKMLVEIDNEIKRDNYFTSIVEKYGVSAGALRAEMDIIGKDVGIVVKHQDDIVSEDKNRRFSKDSIVLAQRNILTFIVSHKDIFSAVKEYIKPEEFADELYGRVAKLIYDLYEENIEINPAMIINKFTELQEQNMVAQVFNNDTKVGNQMQFEKMINESIFVIKNAYIDKKSQEIATVEDMQELITLKRQVQNLYISLKN